MKPDGLGQMNQLLRHTLLGEDPLDHGSESAGTLGAGNQRPMPAIREIMDIPQDRVAYRERQLGDRRRYLLPHLVLEPGIDREGHRQNIFQRCFFELGIFDIDRGAHPGQVIAVNGIDQLIQPFIVTLRILGVLLGGIEHQVNRGVELAAGIRDVAGPIGGLAAFEGLFGTLDQPIAANRL